MGAIVGAILMALITVKELGALTAEDAGKRITDGSGMFGMVRTTRQTKMPISVDFEWRFKLNGRSRQVRIGSWPKISLKALRDTRDKLAAEVKSGSDPIERRAAERLKRAADSIEAVQVQRDRLQVIAGKQARLTVCELFDLWQTLALRHRKDSGTEARRAFERDVFPQIGEMAAGDVSKAHIQAIVDTMMSRNVVRMAKRVLSDLRQMFCFALDRDLVEQDPTARIKKSKIGPDTERDRVLSEEELSDLFKRLGVSALLPNSKSALVIQIATLARIGEILSARWDDVDFTRRQWILPTTKNGRPHRIWLSDFALNEFREIHSLTGMTSWVFPNAMGSGPLDSKTVTKQVADRQRDAKPMSHRTKRIHALTLSGGPWRPHDLRRTGASMMAELGVLPDVIERCLNHTEANALKRIYQRPSYEKQMQDAWRTLGQRLAGLMHRDSTVIPLRIAA